MVASSQYCPYPIPGLLGFVFVSYAIWVSTWGLMGSHEGWVYSRWWWPWVGAILRGGLGAQAQGITILLEGLPCLMGKLHVTWIRVLVLLPCLLVRDARSNSVFSSNLPFP